MTKIKIYFDSWVQINRPNKKNSARKISDNLSNTNFVSENLKNFFQNYKLFASLEPFLQYFFSKLCCVLVQNVLSWRLSKKYVSHEIPIQVQINFLINMTKIVAFDANKVNWVICSINVSGSVSRPFHGLIDN